MKVNSVMELRMMYLRVCNFNQMRALKGMGLFNHFEKKRGKILKRKSHDNSTLCRREKRCGEEYCDFIESQWI